MVSYGLALDFGSYRNDLRTQFEQHCALIQDLSVGGPFDSIWAGESYPLSPGQNHSSVGAFHLPSPLLLLASLGERTPLRLGTGATLLPAYHPLRLAYDIAVLDQLLRGRLTMGLAIGNPLLMKRFGRSGHRGHYADEALTAIKALLSGESETLTPTFTIKGGIGPLPFQEGGPPIWVAGRVRAGAERAAALGDGLYGATTASLQEIRELRRHYDRALAESSGAAKEPVFAANRMTIVAPTGAEARDIGARYAMPVFHYYRSIGTLRADVARPSVETILRDYCIVGDPDSVRAQVRAHLRAGLTHINFRVSPSDTPLDLARQTIRLLREVLLTPSV